MLDSGDGWKLGVSRLELPNSKEKDCALYVPINPRRCLLTLGDSEYSPMYIVLELFSSNDARLHVVMWSLPT